MFIRNLLFLIAAALLLQSCGETQNKSQIPTAENYITYDGTAEGTFFHIVYSSNELLNEQISNTLIDFEKSLSTYDPESIISKINKNDSTVVPDEYFLKFFERSVEVSEATDGAFDITVMPLVNAWGFGFEQKGKITEALIDSLREYTGYKKVRIENNKIIKEDPRIMLDGSAIAKGYSVDVICDLLDNQKIENYLVEIGGEVRTKGQNAQGNDWSIGIDKPMDDPSAENRELQAVVSLSGKAVATSGNYRNFYYIDGVKYAHTIDPFTGYPVQHRMLSVSVLADDCISADAFATAFMVMGIEKSKKVIESNKSLEAYFIYSENDGKIETFASEGFRKLIQEQEVLH